MNITYKQYPPTLAATVRIVVQKRAEIQERLEKLVEELPPEQIAGPRFCIFNFIIKILKYFY